jgi:hypothetical protein
MKRLAILGNHLPRQCGIATFTTHLADALATAAPDVDSFVLAMNDAGRKHPYPARVRFEIAEGDLGSYTPGGDGDAINLYYGAADTSIALATGSIGQLLDWLDRHGTAT